MVFQPGQSGNPSGRPVLPEEIRVRLRDLTPAAIDALEGALSARDDRVRIAAASTLLDRAWGKPAQQSDVNLSTSVEPANDEYFNLLMAHAARRAKEPLDVPLDVSVNAESSARRPDRGEAQIAPGTRPGTQARPCPCRPAPATSPQTDGPPPGAPVL